MEQSNQSQSVKLLVKKLDSNAKLPGKLSPNTVGYDLYALQDCVVSANDKQLVKTGLSFQIPPSHCARLSSKLSIAMKSQVTVENSVLGEDYRGEVQVLLMNHSANDFNVVAGDLVAEVILEKVTLTECEEVQEMPEQVQKNEEMVVESGKKQVNEEMVSESGRKEKSSNKKGPRSSKKQPKLHSDLTSIQEKQSEQKE